MSYIYHGTTGLIALPNRTVQTFPSGLVRVERSFVCRKDSVAKFRNTLKVNEPMPFDDGAPAIDGLYIFPEPQEIVRDDGFVEFRVTAYGRTDIFSDISIQKSSSVGTYNVSVERVPPAADTDINLPSINDIFIKRGVVEASKSTSEILLKPIVDNPSVIPVREGVPLKPIYYISEELFQINNLDLRQQRIVSIDIVLDSYSSTNFGRWSEYTVTWRAQGFDRTFFIV